MMKLAVLVAVVALAAAEQPGTFIRELGPTRVQLGAGQPSTRAVDTRSVLISNRIIQFVENYRYDIAHGNDAHPPLDPFRAEEFGPFIFGTEGLILLRIRLLLHNLEVTGLNRFVIEELIFSLLRMNLSFRVVIPEIIAETGYAAEARLALLATHRATGLARVVVRGIEVDGFMQLTVRDGSLQASELKLDIVIRHTHVNLTELTGVGAVDFVINWILQNVSNDLIQDSMAGISAELSQELLDTVNKVLGQYTLEDLIG